MKVGIVYYSMTGNVEYAVKKIKERIDADLIKISPVKAYPDKGLKKFLWGGKSAVMGEAPELEPYEFNENEYDQIIFAFPVWAGTFTPPIRTFVNENKEALKDKKISVCVCLSGSGAENAIQKLRGHIGIERFKAQLILIDPKDRPKEDNEKKIEKFCNLIK